jgi:hypothetical protein
METIKNVLIKIKEWSLSYEHDVDFILRMESQYDISQLKKELESEKTRN